MSDFICIKGLTLGGIDYTPGQEIPAGAVLPSRVRALLRQGYIAQVDEAPKGQSAPPAEPQEPVMVPAPITIPLTIDGGVYEVVAAPEDILAVASVLQLTVEEGKKIIEGIERDEVLILINALDSRKGIKEASRARAEALDEAQGGGGGA